MTDDRTSTPTAPLQKEHGGLVAGANFCCSGACRSSPFVGILRRRMVFRSPPNGLSGIAAPPRFNKEIILEKKYWLGRNKAATALARGATEAEARLIHYDLAGRYSVKAAACDRPFLAARPGFPSAGEEAAMRGRV